MVGAVRFELTTSCTRNKRASQATLRPDPKGAITCRVHLMIANENGLKPAAALVFRL